MPKDRPKTILESVEPLTESERREHELERLPEWFSNQIELLVSAARLYPNLAKELCDKVITSFAQDDRLGPSMLRSIELERSGNPTGRRAYPKGDLIFLLLKYDRLCQEGSSASAHLELAGELNISVTQVEKKITKARKVLSPDDFEMLKPSPEFPAFLKRQRLKK